jgi:hypothetical protein
MLRKSVALACLLAIPGVAQAQITVHPDGSAEGTPTTPQPLVTRGIVFKQTAVTLNFNDLAAGEVVAQDRYGAQGVQITTGPGSTAAGVVTGSGSAGPCDGTRSIQTEPFTGPSILFRFPDGASDVALSSGDFGPSDQDVITLTAYGDDALTMVVASQTVTLAEGAPTGCLALMVAADKIAAVELTSAGSFTNSVFIDNFTFTPAPKFVVQLEKRGRTDVEAANGYSENTKIRATVVYPPGDPKAGQRVRDFNGMITFEEEPATTYYDGNDGATSLPMTVQASSGRAEIEIKSVSNSNNTSGPVDAGIRAHGPELDEDAATNPLAVDQWVDENGDGFIDWLEESATAIHRCFRGQSGEVKTVEGKVSRLEQTTTACGTTPAQLANRSPIRISPVCGTPNRHRLNVTNELSDTVAHEARHAWQNSERNRHVGTNDDGNNATPRNDDDLDFFLEVVSFPSANLITEMVSGTGEATADPGGVAAWETDAPTYAGAHRNACP